MNLSKLIKTVGATMLVALSVKSGLSQTPVIENKHYLTPKEVETTINKLGFKYPDIVYAQYKIESGLGSSNLSMNYFNLFGMKQYRSRGGLSIGVTKTGFAIYRTHRESITDRLLWEYYTGVHKLSRTEYLKVMRDTYCNGCGVSYLDL